jgi:hypothetical protein
MSSFEDDVGKDMYPVFFEASRERGTALSVDLTFDAYDVHKVYKQLPLQALSKAAGSRRRTGKDDRDLVARTSWTKSRSRPSTATSKSRRVLAR